MPAWIPATGINPSGRVPSIFTCLSARCADSRACLFNVRTVPGNLGRHTKFRCLSIESNAAGSSATIAAELFCNGLMIWNSQGLRNFRRISSPACLLRRINRPSPGEHQASYFLPSPARGSSCNNCRKGLRVKIQQTRKSESL